MAAHMFEVVHLELLKQKLLKIIIRKRLILTLKDNSYVLLF